MIKKFIGSADVINGKAEYQLENLDELPHGKQKLYIAYTECDGYIVSEAWENVFIKIPTSISFANTELSANANSDPEHSENTRFVVFVNNTLLEPVHEGKVQFFIKTEADETFIPIGEPVDVIDGEAWYEYEVPNLPQTSVLVKAEYLSNAIYGRSATSDILTLHIRGGVSITLHDMVVNPSSTGTITAIITNTSDTPISGGNVNFYLDNVLIHTVEGLDTEVLSFDYEFPSDIQGGNHLLKAEYVGSSQFTGTAETATIYVRKRVVIDDSIIYAPQTIDVDGELLQGTAHIPLNVRDIYGNKINEGEVTFNCMSKEETVQLSVDEQEFTLDIPIGKIGGDEIPFALTYHESELYRSTTIVSKIIIQMRTIVEPDGVHANQGDDVTLSSQVVDENGANVPSGDVSFELETNEDNP